jgi:hypothetical protein
LFSVSRATEDNLEFRVTAKGMTIFRGGRFVSKALKDNGVYWLNPEIIQASEQVNVMAMITFHCLTQFGIVHISLDFKLE